MGLSWVTGSSAIVWKVEADNLDKGESLMEVSQVDDTVHYPLCNVFRMINTIFI